MKRFLVLILSISLFGSIGPARAEILSHRCPYSCAKLGFPKPGCKDWRVGDTCFVETSESAPKTQVICMRLSDGTLHVRRTCKKDLEQRMSYESLVGARGPSGDDGLLRIFGDGSAGDRTFSSSEIYSDGNPQYGNISIEAGVTVTVPSGTIFRCTGTFVNNGTITVQPGLRDSNRFGDNGRLEGSPSSSGAESPGGAGGSALPAATAKRFLRAELAAGGNGYRERGDSGGDGGGNFTVLCKGAVSNNGTIEANGEDAGAPYRGGGAGGFILLASMSEASNTGILRATGGDGGSFLAVDSSGSGFGPGGGGGGGLVHLIAPTVSNSGSVDLAGGAGGAAAGAGTITGFVYFGGGGGGGAGGTGGQGGTVNPGNSGTSGSTAAQSGASGRMIQTAADPISLF